VSRYETGRPAAPGGSDGDVRQVVELLGAESPRRAEVVASATRRGPTGVVRAV